GHVRLARAEDEQPPAPVRPAGCEHDRVQPRGVVEADDVRAFGGQPLGALDPDAGVRAGEEAQTQAHEVVDERAGSRGCRAPGRGRAAHARTGNVAGRMGMATGSCATAGSSTDGATPLSTRSISSMNRGTRPGSNWLPACRWSSATLSSR